MPARATPATLHVQMTHFKQLTMAAIVALSLLLGYASPATTCRNTRYERKRVHFLWSIGFLGPMGMVLPKHESVTCEIVKLPDSSQKCPRIGATKSYKAVPIHLLVNVPKVDWQGPWPCFFQPNAHRHVATDRRRQVPWL